MISAIQLHSIEGISVNAKLRIGNLLYYTTKHRYLAYLGAPISDWASDGAKAVEYLDNQDSGSNSGMYF